MINVFRMDWYRFKWNKIMYILLLVFCLFEIFGIFMMDHYGQQMEGSGVQFDAMNASEFIQYTLSQTPSWVMFYILIFTVYFYMSEYNSGFYKNYITMKNARVHSVLSKILIQGVFTVLIFMVLVISDLIGRGIFFDNLLIGDVGYFAKVLIGQFALHWAFSILILCIAIMTRSMLASLIIGMILVLNVLGMVIGAIETLISGIHVSKYWLVNTITTILDFNNIRDLVHISSVAMISILLFSIIAINYKLKEDLR